MLLAQLLLALRYLLNRSALELTFQDIHSFKQQQFLHAVATPLTVLRNYEDSISNKQQIAVALDSLQHLFTDFFSNSVVKQCSVKKLLMEVAIIVSSAEHKVHIFADEPLVVSKVNSARLREVFICLINNALQSDEHKSSSVYVLAKQKNGAVYIRIIDHGKGMTSLEQLLVCWPKLSFRQGGSGIGLHFAKQVVEQELGGSIEIHSKVGWGSVITCKIPVSR